MPDGVSSHLHIVRSTDNDEIIRVSGPLDADDGQRTSIGWCLGACAEKAVLARTI